MSFDVAADRRGVVTSFAPSAVNVDLFSSSYALPARDRPVRSPPSAAYLIAHASQRFFTLVSRQTSTNSHVRSSSSSLWACKTIRVNGSLQGFSTLRISHKSPGDRHPGAALDAHPFKQYVASSYVKWVEMAGERPIAFESHLSI